MATGITKSFYKAAIERRRLYLDYTCWLAENERLSSIQVTVSPYTATNPLITNTSYADANGKKLVMYVSGGEAKQNYTLQVVIGTSDGQTKRDDIMIQVAR